MATSLAADMYGDDYADNLENYDRLTSSQSNLKELEE